MRLSMLDAIIAFLWSSDMGSQTFVHSEVPQQEAASLQDLIYETTTGYVPCGSERPGWQALFELLTARSGRRILLHDSHAPGEY